MDSPRQPQRPERDTLKFPQFSPALHDMVLMISSSPDRLKGETGESQLSVTSARWRKDNNNISKVALKLSGITDSGEPKYFVIFSNNLLQVNLDYTHFRRTNVSRVVDII